MRRGTTCTWHRWRCPAPMGCAGGRRIPRLRESWQHVALQDAVPRQRPLSLRQIHRHLEDQQTGRDKYFLLQNGRCAQSITIIAPKLQICHFQQLKHYFDENLKLSDWSYVSWHRIKNLHVNQSLRKELNPQLETVISFDGMGLIIN